MEAVPGDTPFCTITHTCNLEYAAQELFFTSLPCSPFYMKVLIPQSCPAACNLMDCSLPGNFCPWNSSGKNTGMGCHFLLQRIFPTQVMNLGLPHCRQTLPSEPPGKHCYVSSTKSKCYEDREDVQFTFISLQYLAQNTVLSR